MSEEIVWTAREAMACALCWVGFHDPEKTKNGSPEAYWRDISESARCVYRRAANDQLLLAVARGQAVPIVPGNALTDRDMAHLGEKMRLKATHRIRQCYDAVWHVFALKARS